MEYGGLAGESGDMILKVRRPKSVVKNKRPKSVCKSDSTGSLSENTHFVPGIISEEKLIS